MTLDKRNKIAILGYGVEGKSILNYLLKHGYSEVTVCDSNVDIEADLPKGVSASCGPEYLDGLADFEVIFRSPGVRYLEPQIQLAVENGVKVTSCIGFFIDQCLAPVVGVTGTKGKGTTATLIFEMLKKAGKKAYLGGNIGEPPTDFLDEVKGSDIVVLELSSFQLQDLGVSPQYAVLLNTTTDHLDYHEDRGEYLRAKEALLAHQGAKDVAVLNADYEYFKYYKPLVKGELRTVSVEGKVKDGAYVEGDAIFYCKGGACEEVMPVSEVALIGSHNLENVLPAVTVARELGVKVADVAEVVREFKGLPHRLEFVKEVEGVRFYNDSFSTTTETSMAAVDSFDEPLILIAGGSDKGLDYGEWAVRILTKRNLETVILIGETADKMEAELLEAEGKLGEAEGSPTKILRRPDLGEAILTAFAESEAGSVVVMSPAAASFDLFENYKKRGEEFRAVVRALR